MQRDDGRCQTPMISSLSLLQAVRDCMRSVDSTTRVSNEGPRGSLAYQPCYLNMASYSYRVVSALIDTGPWALTIQK